MLFAFGSFAHDAESILTAVHRLALVGIELFLNVLALELGIASFAHADGRRRAFLNDTQVSGWHDRSPTHPCSGLAGILALAFFLTEGL